MYYIYGIEGETMSVNKNLSNIIWYKRETAMLWKLFYRVFQWIYTVSESLFCYARLITCMCV